MMKSDPFDIVIVGGGCTGAGAALDATTRGLKVACVERGDFSNETSSRSSKLIWGGFKYLQVAFSELMSTNTLYEPIKSVSKFYSEFSMVVECCQERSWLAGMQNHLVRYVPQAVPFSDWIMWPAPFNHPFYSILPIIALPAFLFYDGLAGFNSPTSYAMGPRKAKENFPQLADELKYSAVYCEAMHNDARTGTAIALTAAQHGSTIANYVEMVGLVKDSKGVATGIKCLDKLTGEKFEIKANAVILATGAFLDSVRKMEDPNAEKAVAAAAGLHIVLPGYFTPGGMGLCNLRTKRGATMYFLPWQGHTIVGSTDKKCDATSSPAPTEDDIQYLVNEAASCLSNDIRVRRSDVLSAWQGWRPLYRDPNAPPGAPVSRHHAIGVDEKTGVLFICGGKWSTYRAMAEELIDRVIKEKDLKRTLKITPCVTKGIKLIGGDGYHDLLYVQIIQKYGLSEPVARHLCHTYGAAAFAVCENAEKHKGGKPFDQLVQGYPYIEAEIEYACKNEYAVTAKDMLTLRMRLAYLNSEAAKKCVPRVVEVMGDTLGWSSRERGRQKDLAYEYIGQFGGPISDKKGTQLRARTYTDLLDIFNAIDTDGSGYIDEDVRPKQHGTQQHTRPPPPSIHPHTHALLLSTAPPSQELSKAAKKLGFPFKDKSEAKATFLAIDKDGNGRITSQVRTHAKRSRRAYVPLCRALPHLTPSHPTPSTHTGVHRVVEQQLLQRFLEEAPPDEYDDRGERGRDR